MKMHTHSSLLVLVIAVFAAHTPARADFIVDQWQLAVGIRDFASGEEEFANELVVTNPFQAAHDVAVDPSTAEATYDFYWDGGGGVFNVTGAQTAAGGSLFSASSGMIFFHTDVPLRFDVTGQYTYALPAGDREARFSATILDVSVSPSIGLFSQAFSAAPIFGDPPSGTWNIDGSVIIPPGPEYMFKYNMRLDSFTGSPSVLSTGQGFVNFAVTAVPEPTTAALLLVATPVFFRRRRRRRRSR